MTRSEVCCGKTQLMKPKKQNQQKEWMRQLRDQTHRNFYLRDLKKDQKEHRNRKLQE